MDQCKAIIFIGRTRSGGRSGLAAPRCCREPAGVGDYCSTHKRHKQLQDLYRDLLGSMWEIRVERWRREQEFQARMAVRRY